MPGVKEVTHDHSASKRESQDVNPHIPPNTFYTHDDPAHGNSCPIRKACFRDGDCKNEARSKTEHQIIDLEENSEFMLNVAGEFSIAVPHGVFHGTLVQNKIPGPDKFGK